MLRGDPYKAWRDPEPLPGRDCSGRILRRGEEGGWDSLPSTFKAPNRGKAFSFKKKRLVRCWHCSSLFEGWGRVRYCSARCSRNAKTKRRCERFGGHEPGTLHHHLSHPDAILIPRRKRQPVRDRDGMLTPEHPGWELAIPMSVDLTDALARLLIAGFFPETSSETPLLHWDGEGAVPVPKVHIWDRFLHDLLLGALRKVIKGSR